MVRRDQRESERAQSSAERMLTQLRDGPGSDGDEYRGRREERSGDQDGEELHDQGDRSACKGEKDGSAPISGGDHGLRTDERKSRVGQLPVDQANAAGVIEGSASKSESIGTR